jgi:hypothetical protein
VPKQPIRNIKKNDTALYKAIQKEPKSEPSGALAHQVVSHLISGNPTEPFGRLIRAKRRTKDWNHHDRIEPYCETQTFDVCFPGHTGPYYTSASAFVAFRQQSTKDAQSTYGPFRVVHDECYRRKGRRSDRLVSRATVLRTEQ